MLTNTYNPSTASKTGEEQPTLEDSEPQAKLAYRMRTCLEGGVGKAREMAQWVVKALAANQHDNKQQAAHKQSLVFHTCAGADIHMCIFKNRATTPKT